MTSRSTLPCSAELKEHQSRLQSKGLADLLQAGADRTARFTLQAAGLSIDLSRHYLDDALRATLVAQAQACELPDWRARLLAGAAINSSEERPAWHTALRTPPADAAWATRLADERERMLRFAEDLRAGRVRGASGQPIDTVIAIGIGGSDLGPRLAVDALGAGSGPRLHFVTNLDPLELDSATTQADPARTLILAISKSFSTLETRENLQAARRWFAQAAPQLDIAPHLYAVSSQPQRAAAFGIAADRVFTFPDWVGGRYSLWSACGLPVAIVHGRAAFTQLLAGATAMDAHFADAPLAANAPVLLGLLGAWYVNSWGLRTRAVFPYAQRLARLPAYLQQLEMESLGKRVDRAGSPLPYDTAPVLWGDVGSTAQHSVFQFLHQGTHIVPTDFVVVDPASAPAEPRAALLAAFAHVQADALALGDAALGAAAATRAPYARTPGGRPSTLITAPRLDAQVLGALLALHEHRTFVQSVLWNINPFDQWGVEIGKQLLALRTPAA